MFGRSEEREYDVTYGMNTKGGMDNGEFVLYILNNLFGCTQILFTCQAAVSSLNVTAVRAVSKLSSLLS